MDFLKENADIGFNLEQAKKSVDAYSSSVGIQCMIIDFYGKTLYISTVDGKACRFCEKIQGLPDKYQNCVNAHLYGGYLSERFGGKYVFFCPMGLVHWASPIISEGTMKGAVLGGPVQMVESDEFLIEEILQKNHIKGSKLVEIRQHITEIPVIKPEVVNNLSELLFIVATYISDIQPSKYLNEREYYEHQSYISEYIHYIKTMGGNDSNLESYPIEKEKELLSLIALGDKAGAQKVLNEIFGHIFFSTGGNFEVVKARVLELIVLLSRAALEGGADVEQIFGLNYKYLNEIHGFKTVEELTYWLSKIMARFTDLVFNLTNIKHVDVIYKAIDYIKRNYMKKITLEEVASYVYLSPSYFSKIFKEEMKVNFNTYLNYVRIEKSKKLLLDDSIVLVDLSNLVGFEDQSYFSKVFKKITGVSPGKYRESRGQIQVKRGIKGENVETST
jgi:two-component system response regulator YesN